jgi:hypothetical protein
MSFVDYIVAPQLYCSSGTINPATFIMLDVSNDFGAIAATANGRTIGVASPAVKYPPNSGIGGSNAAVAFEYQNAAGQTVADGVYFFGPGSVCNLQLGGTVTRGDLLEADSAGRGVTSGTSGHNVGALALESGSINEFRKVVVVVSNHP